MLLAIDVHYRAEAVVSVGILFETWQSAAPNQIIKLTSPPDVADYQAGQFYKRELPYILQILEKIDLSTLDCIIVDG